MSEAARRSRPPARERGGPRAQGRGQPAEPRRAPPRRPRRCPPAPPGLLAAPAARLGSLPARSPGRCPRPPGSPAPSRLPSPPPSFPPARGGCGARARQPSVARLPRARGVGGGEGEGGGGGGLRRPLARAAALAPPRRAPRLQPGERLRDPRRRRASRAPGTGRAAGCNNVPVRAPAQLPPRSPVPLSPAPSSAPLARPPRSDLRRRRGLGGSGSAAGAAQRPGPPLHFAQTCFSKVSAASWLHRPLKVDWGSCGRPPSPSLRTRGRG